MDMKRGTVLDWNNFVLLCWKNFVFFRYMLKNLLLQAILQLLIVISVFFLILYSWASQWWSCLEADFDAGMGDVTMFTLVWWHSSVNQECWEWGLCWIMRCAVSAVVSKELAVLVLSAGLLSPSKMCWGCTFSLCSRRTWHFPVWSFFGKLSKSWEISSLGS